MVARVVSIPLWGTVAASGVALFAPPGIVRYTALLAGTADALLVAHASRDGLPDGFACAVGVLAAMAVARVPIGSADLWSYAFSGRALAIHHLDPYRTTPARWSTDPASRLAGWKHTPDVYGPVFTAVEATVAKLAGRSVVALRLGFQLIAAASMLWVLRVAVASRRFATAVLFGLQPLVWVVIVNGGHIDALTAAILVGAVVAFRRDRTAAAVGLVVAASLVKVTAVFAAGPIAVLLFLRGRYRHAVTALAVPVAALVCSELLVPGSLTNSLHATGGKVSRASLWDPLQLDVAHAGRQIAMVAFVAATLLAAVLSMVVVTRRRDGRQGMGVALSAFPMMAAYVLGWYATMGLAALTVEGEFTLAAIISLRGVLTAAAYSAGFVGIGGDIGLITAFVTPLPLAVWFVVATIRGTGHHDRATGVDAAGWRRTLRRMAPGVGLEPTTH